VEAFCADSESFTFLKQNKQQEGKNKAETVLGFVKGLFTRKTRTRIRMRMKEE
jgi:hypothetical protein